MIKAIETEYRGYWFRSRLEARWAKFFDTLGIPWEYEKEGYSLDGIGYLPDFWLPTQDCWVEIKGQTPSEAEREKARKLALGTRKHVFVLFGDFEPFWQRMEVIDNAPGDIVRYGALGHAFLYRDTYQDVYFSDTFYMFGECSRCHNIVISFFGHSSRGADDTDTPWFLSSKNECCCYCPTKDDYKSPRILAAYKAARQARFEHR